MAAAVRVTCKVTPIKGKGDVFDKEYEVKSGDVHLKSLSSTLRILQKEVNEVLTVIVDKEKADQSSAGKTDNDVEMDDDEDDDEDDKEPNVKKIKR